MPTITVREVQADFQRYLDRVEQGESFIVVRDNKPVAEIRPAAPKPQHPRPVGLAKGTFTVPAEFFEPLPAEILDAFEGKVR
ncbi:type II toxin-antitoxin system Phd/YefM family antitoxin [Fontivita pretiosa]|jgi:prevent-host-death family protein|uniref:type II toxin-antitoxin system Phd/YefM family antitoxin n=1 Tax=Fontivita pretiosa TaxID=2989684 RepID=UPI003D173DF3